jgi:hypothetical protein
MSPLAAGGKLRAEAKRYELELSSPAAVEFVPETPFTANANARALSFPTADDPAPGRDVTEENDSNA